MLFDKGFIYILVKGNDMMVDYIPVLVDYDYGHRHKIKCCLKGKNVSFTYMDNNGKILSLRDFIFSNKEFKYVRKGFRESIVNGTVVSSKKEYLELLETLSKCITKYNRNVLEYYVA